MQTKPRILASAPYEGMKTLLLQTAQEFPEVDLHVIVGDLKEGLALTMNRFPSDFDVLMSRGGTASLLRQSLTLPVVEIPVTGNDILRTLKLAGAQDGRCAVVGFPNVIGEMQTLRTLLPYQIDVFPISDENEIHSTLTALAGQAYSAILCDMVTHTAANKLGMNTFLITSGAESIREAIRNAIYIYNANIQLQSDNQFFRTLLQRQDTQTIVFSESGKLVYTSQQNEQSELLQILHEKISTLPDSDRCKLVLQVQGVHYRILPRRIAVQDQRYLAFFYTAVPASDSRSRPGMIYRSCDQVEEDYLHGPYRLVEFAPAISNQVFFAGAQNAPTLFLGEDGAGQTYAAQMLYLKSDRRNGPFVEIDCACLQKKSWHNLLHHPSSPLYDTGNTLYFLHTEALQSAQLQSLCAILSSGNALRQNTVLFSVSCQSASCEACAPLTGQLGCRVITLPPLRSAPDAISRLIYLFLNNSGTCADPDSAISKEALHLLCQYDWPQNYRQLARVFERAAVMAAGGTITEGIVRDALAQEVFLVQAAHSGETAVSLDISRPLSELEHTIAQMVLRRNAGNHSLTAESLGISRTTLWRMLKSHQEP